MNRVAPDAELDAELARLIDAIISKPREVIAFGKKVFYQQVEMPMAKAYGIAADAMACNVMMEDAAEGVGAFIAKRKPDWKT